MATYHALAITIRCRRLGEADRVLTLYSRERGPIDAVVKGVGKPKSKLTPVTQLLSCNRLLLAEGKSLDVVTQVQVVDAFYPLRTDVLKLGWCCYLTELVAKTTEPGQASPELFELLRGTLAEQTRAIRPESLVRAFECRLLDLLGFAPGTDTCGTCGGSPAGDTIAYLASAGRFYCGDCAGATPGAMQVCQGTLQAFRSLAGMPLDRVSRLALGPQIAAELRRVLRAHIDYHIGARFRSLDFLGQLQQNAVETP
jgi:DNA repair protein RecO (recombination protein O)